MKPGVIVTLPAGWDVFQMKPEQPKPTDPPPGMGDEDKQGGSTE